MFRTVIRSGFVALALMASVPPAEAQIIILKPPTPEEIEAQHRKLLNDWINLYLGRKATEKELVTMLTRINKGATPNAIQTSILSSPDYWKKVGGNAQGFIQGLYNDVLGRKATPQEVLKLSAQVNGTNRETFVAEFLKQTNGK